MTIQNYASGLITGLSTDTKPTAANTQTGFRFIETDTGNEYINNGTAWVLRPFYRPSKHYAIVFQNYDAGTTTTTPVPTYAIKYDGSIIATGTSGTDDATVINAALTAANGKGSVFIAGAKYRSNTSYYPAWLCGAQVDISSFQGEIEGSEVQSANNTFGKTVLRKTYVGTGDFILDNNTSGLGKRIKNITFQGGNPQDVSDTNLDTAIGLNTTNAQNGRYLENVYFERFNIGWKATKLVYHSAYDVTIDKCATYGVWYYTTGGPINTVYWYGGRVTNCGINVFLDTGSNDTGWFGTVLEAGITSNLKIADTANGHNFVNCSQEINPTPLGRADPTTVIDDGGNNNTYINNRFMMNDRPGITAITFRSTSRRSKMQNCWYGGLANAHIYLKIESGAEGHLIERNTSNSNTAPRVIVLDVNNIKNHKWGNKDHRTTMMYSPEIKRVGDWHGVTAGSSTGAGATGLLQGMMNFIGSSGGRQVDSQPLRTNFDTTTTINTVKGINVFTWANRIKNPITYVYFRLNSIANVRIFLGFNSSNTTPATAADQLASRHGIGFWYDDAVNSTWQLSSNSGSANQTLVNTAITPDTNWHSLQIQGWDALTKFQWSYDGSIPTDVSSPIPAQTQSLGNYFTIENTTAASRTLDIGFIHIEEDPT